VCTEHGVFHSQVIFTDKLDELGLQLPDSDDGLMEVKIGGYDVCHAVLYFDTDSK